MKETTTTIICVNPRHSPVNSQVRQLNCPRFWTYKETVTNFGGEKKMYQMRSKEDKPYT